MNTGGTGWFKLAETKHIKHMSAKLTYNEDGKAMVFFGNNDKPWWWGSDTSRRGKEDIGYLYPDQRTAKEALQIISPKTPFIYKEAIPMYGGSAVEGYKMVVNPIGNKVISIVSDKYKVQQPSEFAAVIDKVFGNTMVVDTFGTIDDGRLLFSTTKVKSSYFNDSKESEMVRMITFLGSCDYTTPFRVVFSSIRTVCWNTFTPQLRAQRAFSARHTPNMNENIRLIQEKIGLSEKYWNSLDDLLRGLSEETIRKEDTEKFVKELFEYESGKTKQRTINKIRDVYSLSTREAKKYGYTRAALLNGVTEFVSHPERRTHGNINIKQSRLGQEIGNRLGENDKLVDRAIKILTSDSSELESLALN